MDRERARARRSDNQRRRVGSDGSKLGQADVGRASDPGGASVEEGAQKSEIMPKREEREREREGEGERENERLPCQGASPAQRGGRLT